MTRTAEVTPTSVDTLRAQCELLGASISALHGQVDAILAHAREAANDPSLMIPQRPVLRRPE